MDELFAFGVANMRLQSRPARVKGLTMSALKHALRCRDNWQDRSVALSLLDSVIEKLDALLDAQCEAGMEDI